LTSELRDRLQATLGGGYTLERELGGGGMSRVFVAEDERLGRRVVVKVLAPELTEGLSAERFEREVRLVARLQHPNVVPLLAAGERDGLAYYTMPYVEGESLRARLARGERLSLPAAVSVLRDVARALEYAHGHGFVHRDIKPDNILLSGSAAAVADFGIAKAIHTARTAGNVPTATGTLTRDGTSIGTPAYMAPEQAAGDPDVDARADVYSWGVVAYELVSGSPPFAGRSTHRLVAAHIGEAPPPLAVSAPDTPPALAALIMRCLEKDPARRPSSAGELLTELEATHTTPGERVASKAVSPYRLAAGLGIALMVIVLGVLAFRAGSSSAPSRPVLAVLPFENVGAAGDAYFADGLTEEVRSRLTRISGLQVIGGRSAGQYKGTTKSSREIARELGATHLLTGTVRWERSAGGGRVRVSPELVRGTDQASVWAEQVEGPIGEVFALQARVAERVASALDVALLGHERRTAAAIPTKDLAAYDAYLRGLAFGSTANRFSAEARRAFTAAMEQAVALDPGFAAAHSRLAESYLQQYGFGNHSGDLLTRARESVARAMKLDSTLMETQLARGSYLAAIDDVEGALRAFQAAERVAPGNPEVLMSLGNALDALGRSEEAIPLFQRIEQLEPRWAEAPASIAGTYRRLGRYEESIKAAERTKALTPIAGFHDLFYADAYLLWRGDTAGARRVLESGPTRPAMDELTRLPSPFAGRAIWLSVFPRAVIVAKDTITRAGYVRGDWGTADLYHVMKARHFMLTGRPTPGRAHADSAIALLEPALRHRSAEGVLFGYFPPEAMLAEAYAYVGRTAEAARVIDGFVEERQSGTFPQTRARDRPDRLVMAAYVDVLLGRRDLAVARLEEALRLGDGASMSRALLRADPSWSSLHGHPGYERLIAAAS
jgi:serine/threonine-protein kinase